MKTGQLIATLGMAVLMGVSGHAAQLNVFAAASLSDALKEIGTAYENALRLLGVAVAMAFVAVWASEWLMRRRRNGR